MPRYTTHINCHNCAINLKNYHWSFSNDDTYFLIDMIHPVYSKSSNIIVIYSHEYLYERLRRQTNVDGYAIDVAKENREKVE